ncbi:MAG: hypothetical protein KIS92_21805 [Planctomycetota bacterium]|nr:hypothetical protein [Planctomycetota bacterium]
MIRGVRKPEEAQKLGLSRRLMVRVGALLKHQVEISAAILEAARPGTPHEALLLDPALLDGAANLDEATLGALSTNHLKVDPKSYDAPALLAEDGRKVICLREELEAGGGWDTEPEAATEAPAPAQLLAAVPSGALSARSVSGEGGEPLFSRNEIDRLRLKLVTAASASERIEALRILAHAPTSPHEKAEAIFLGLEDREASVRGEAAGLLFVLGIADDLRESLQALCEPREDLRTRGAERLIKLLSQNAKDVELGAAAVLALATLKPETAQRVAVLLLQILGLCSGTLMRTPQRVAELVRVVLGRISSVVNTGASTHTVANTYTPAAKLIRKLCSAAPDITLPMLREEHSKCTEPAIEAFLLQVLLEHSNAGSPEESATLKLAAGFLARDTQEGRDSRTIGMAMIHRGEPALYALADEFNTATQASQKYFLRLFEDLVRYQNVSVEAKERATACLLRAMESGSRGMRIVAMHCRFPAEPDISEATRGKVAQAFLASITDFGFKTDIEIAEDGIARMGLPALKPLLDRLAPERPAETRVQAVRILGNLALELHPPKGEMARTTDALTEALRRLQALSSEPDFPGQAVLLTALGKLCASPAAARQADDVIRRRLLQAVSSGEREEEVGALEGLAYLASSRRADAQLIATVSGLLRRALDETRDDLVAETIEVAGEKVIEIKQGEDLVEKLPVALAGLSRIVRSTSCPTNFVKELTRELIARWKKIINGDLVWGPANAMLAVKALHEIGAQSSVNDEVRMEVLKALAPRIGQIPVMGAIASILHANDTEPTSLAALTVGLNILGRRTPDGRYDAEDRPDILKCLAKIAARKALGPTDPRGREKTRNFRKQVVEDLFQGTTDHVTGAYEGLSLLRDAKVLVKEDQEQLERRLTELHQISVA